MRTVDASVPRVLHVVGAMNVGGAETLLMNLYRKVDRSAVQFDFLVFGRERGVYDDEIGRLGGRILRLRNPRTRGLRAATADVRRLLRSEGPFVAVHAHVLHASAIALRAARREGIPVRVAHSHSTGDVEGGLVRDLYERWARRSIASHANCLIACGDEAGAYLFGQGASWEVLPNGVDLDNFRPPSAGERNTARQSLGVSDEAVVLGAVARLETVKNHELMIDLGARLASLGQPFVLLFAGDGSLRRHLEDKVRSLGLSDQVRFLGLRRDIPQLMAALDALVMPSLYEGFPVSLVEAQATGLPCLVSDAISKEVDLGLGLVEFLPLDSLERWIDAVRQAPRRRLPAERVDDVIRGSAADINESVSSLYGIYQLGH